MVCYCCVKGCNNNSNNKKKDHNSIVSFHAFPSNQQQKRKWLKAIGRPNWVPPSHTRICSTHFKHDQINYDSCRIRIKDDAIPVNNLPLNSNFEASTVEVCRICLATDLKMYTLQDTHIITYMDSIIGLNENRNIEGLPQFVCYECAACLVKCYKLVEKSMISQSTLLDIFAQHGQITKNLIQQKDRYRLNLESTLSSHTITNCIYLEYDEKKNTSQVNKSDSEHVFNGTTEVYFKSENDGGSELHHQLVIMNPKYKKGLNSDIYENKLSIDENNKNNKILLNGSRISSPTDELAPDTESEFEDNIKQEILESKVSNNEIRKLKQLKNKLKKRDRQEELTPDETNMKEYFKIIKLSLQEQIEEWKRMVSHRPLTSETIYKCEICLKIFAQVNTYRTHITRHEPSRGKSECAVCKLRFKNDVLMKSHANRAHSKKFHCKTCSKFFNNVGVAKKHQRWHSGYTYRCKTCSFTTAHESSLGVHMRRQHKHVHACADCGLAFVSTRGLGLHRATAHRNLTKPKCSSVYRCEQCKIDFSSEGARRVHILTSYQHRKKSDLCDSSAQDSSLRNTCKKCGVQFSSLSKLISHMRAEHPSQVKRSSWQLPTDSYPTRCQLCVETVSSRKAHWWHVRRHHPKDTSTYQPVITAICDTCGKGFQNSTKLHLHQLRHGSPTVACSACARRFYDKYALARHAATHATDAPHVCRTCGRAFKRRTNLERHSRVHTDATPYECTMCGKKFKYSSSVNLHVRTIHYKLPHPPRKKRSRSSKEALEH